MENDNGLEKYLLSYFYIRNKEKSNKSTQIKQFVLVALMLALSLGLINVFYNESLKYELSPLETTIILPLIISAILYILLTETTFDDVSRHKRKCIASLFIFFLLSLSYSYGWIYFDNEDTSDVWGVLVFVLGLLAWLDNSISNYRDMYKLLASRYKEELSTYFREVDDKIESNYVQISSKIEEAKYELSFWEQVWKKITLKSKLKLIILLVLSIVVLFALSVISSYMSNLYELIKGILWIIR